MKIRLSQLFCDGIVPATLMLATSAVCFAQGNLVPLQPGTVITGQCAGHEGEPGCVLPNLFGSTGLTLFNNPAFPHYAHFTGSAQSTLNQTLSTAIATQLAILPIISPASGFTYKYDAAAGAFVRSSNSFGAIYSERAETIGRGKFSFGVSYQRFRFSTLDGINLHDMPIVFSHVPNTGPNMTAEPYEADVIQTSNNIDLNMDQTMLYGTVGITNRFDISVAIPIVSVRIGASSDASIIRVSGPTFVPAPGVPPVPNPHQFNSSPTSLTNSYSSSGSAAGLGDITLRFKGNIHQGENVRVALALDVRTPTGDARKFLGSGATGIKPFLIVSGGKRFSPHVNIGYQWNGSSILAGDVTGTSVVEQNEALYVQNGPEIKRRLPGQFFYTLGADWGVTNRLTLAVDYLGQTLINAPRVFQTNYTTDNIAGGTGSLNLPTISGGKDTVGLNSGAAGLKLNLFGGLLLTADVLFRLDDKGLRQDVTPLVALSYAFGQ